MILRKTWEKHIFSQILFFFLCFLLGFFVLYTIVDSSMQFQRFSRSTDLSFFQIALYYGSEFIKRIDLLGPLAFLIATMRTLLTMNQKNELLALQAGGLSLGLILRPIMLFALFVSSFLLLNAEIVSPKAIAFVEKIENQHLKRKQKLDQKKPSVYCIEMDSDKKLIYQSFDPINKEFFDVFYYISPNEIWKMKHLNIAGDCPKGMFVDILKRDENGFLMKNSSHESLSLPSLELDFFYKKKKEKPFAEWSLSNLVKALIIKNTHNEYLLPKVKAQLYYKVLISLVPLLILLAICPLCVTYRRNMPHFGLYAIALFGFISFFFLMNAAMILSEHGTIPASIALVFPPFLAFCGCLPSFVKTFYPG